MNREKFPPQDFELGRRNGDHETWENAAQYEIAYQLAKIAEHLERITENLVVRG